MDLDDRRELEGALPRRSVVGEIAIVDEDLLDLTHRRFVFSIALDVLLIAMGYPTDSLLRDAILMDAARDAVMDRVRLLRPEALDCVRSDDGREHVVDSRRGPQRSVHVPYERRGVSDETLRVSVRLAKCVSGHFIEGEVQ